MNFVYASRKNKKITINFTNWDKGFPYKNNPSDNCVQVRHGRWKDKRCAGKKRYVCEMPPDERQEFWDSVPIKHEADSVKAYIFQKFMQC